MEENVEIIENETESGSIESAASDVVSEVTQEVLEGSSSEESTATDSEFDLSNESDTTSETENDSTQESAVEENLEETEVIEEPVDTSTYEALQEIHTTLLHVDSVSQYGVSILIVLLIIVLLNYVYKFFKMFF